MTGMSGQSTGVMGAVAPVVSSPSDFTPVAALYAVLAPTPAARALLSL